MAAKKAAKAHFSGEGNSWFYLQTQVNHVKGRQRISHLGLCCVRISMAALRWSHLFQMRTEGFVQGKVPAVRSSPFHLPVKPCLAAPIATGQLLAFPLPLFKCSPFLTLIIENDISWILHELPEVSSELMIHHISLSCISAPYPTIQDCSCQGSADSSRRMSQFATFRELSSFGGFIP